MSIFPMKGRKIKKSHKKGTGISSINNRVSHKNTNSMNSPKNVAQNIKKKYFYNFMYQTYYKKCVRYRSSVRCVRCQQYKNHLYIQIM